MSNRFYHRHFRRRRAAPDRRRWLAAAAAAALAALAPAARALKVDEHVYPDSVEVARVSLVLNGAGVRSYLWLKAFTAGLYLPQRASQVAAVLDQRGPKRLRLRMLVKVPGHEFAKALRRGVQKNHSGPEQAALADRLQRLATYVEGLGELKSGDAVDLDLRPGEGLAMSLNGAMRGDPIPGDDLYRAVLKIFIGDRPAQKELKAALLGGPPNR